MRKKVTVTTLLCHHHVLYYLLSRYSFSHQLRKLGPQITSAIDFQVVGDPSLRKVDKLILLFFFRHTKVFLAEDAEEIVRKGLNRYDFLSSLRFKKKNPQFNYLRKVLDCHFLAGTKKVIVLDADVIFFRPPKEILSWIKRATQNSKKIFMFTFQDTFVQQFEKVTNKKTWQYEVSLLRKKKKEVGTYNAGIMMYEKSAFSLVKYQKFAKEIFRLNNPYFFQFDEAILPFVFPYIEGLDKNTYFVLDYMENHSNYLHKNIVTCHYTRENKPKMFLDILKRMQSFMT